MTGNRSSHGWEPPGDWKRISTVDAHAAGEPLRVVVGGFPSLAGKTILEKRQLARDRYDELRKALMWEPRGHADMYGCILTEPVTADGDFGVLFLHNEGFSTMCGHGIIALTTVVFETGLIQTERCDPVIRLDTPAGRVTATAHLSGDHVREVSFFNVPSFVQTLDAEVMVEDWGRVRFDIAFGGAFYAFCRSEDLGLRLRPLDRSRIIETGMRIKDAVSAAFPVRHPEDGELGFLYGTIFIGPPEDKDNHSRNVCVFADGELDRSPTGTGISARAAIHFARGEIARDEVFVVESILGTCFSAAVRGTCRLGDFEAVIPEVRGSAHITGRHEFLIDPRDPLRHGFLIR